MGVVRVEYYSDLVAGTMAGKLTKGYCIAVISVIDAMQKNIPQDETVKLVFEQQEEYELNTRLIFNSNDSVTPSGQRRLSGIEFIPKDSSVLTQPADFLAYALSQGFKDQSSKRNPATITRVVSWPVSSRYAVSIRSRFGG